MQVNILFTLVHSEPGKIPHIYGILGMDQGLDLDVLFNNADILGKIQITKVDLTTDPCLPIPKSTANDMIGWILFIITFCLITCILEAYTARWRSQICNLFYPEIAKYRAIHLYEKIYLGRCHREDGLQQIAIKEKTKHENRQKATLLGNTFFLFNKRFEQFSILLFPKLHSRIQSVCRFFNSNFGLETTLCHGCAINVVKEQTSQKEFKNHIAGQYITITLCEDCLLET